MNPRLIAIAGLLKGSVFELVDDELTIGRDASNRVRLEDKSTSRRHAVIRRADGAFVVIDLGSHNGTFVNEVRRDEQPLKHADRLQIGNAHFLFLEGNSLASPENVELDDGSLMTKSKVSVRLEDALYSLARDLTTLMEISARINSAKSLDALQRLLLESVFEIVPAERGAILLADEDLESPHSVFALNKAPGDLPLTISRTVVKQVLKEGVSILSNDVVRGGDSGRPEGLFGSPAKALLCVPLRVFSRTIGIIYLEATEAGTVFSEGQLKLLTAVASFVAGSLENVRHMEWLEGERQRLESEIQIEHSMIGHSPRMQELYQFIAKVSPAESTVLLHGESGTGKEMAARAIHQNGPRARGSFVAVNCAALVEGLLESELFGHEKGAFTGAVAQKKGKLELADGGTIFLDEVAEMSLQVQAKLLRVLQEREFERVGGTRAIKINVRIVAATNKDLKRSIDAGAFREDLYYRLNVISFMMPPLRERAEDIPFLSNHFIAKYSSKCKRRVTGVSPQAREVLIGYKWPGNVRELENAIERAVVLGSTDAIELEDLPDSILETVPPAGRPMPPYYESVREAKIRIIRNALARANCNYTEAARILGVHPNNLHRLMRNLGLK